MCAKQELPLTGSIYAYVLSSPPLLRILSTSSPATPSTFWLITIYDPKPAFEGSRKQRPAIDALKLYDRESDHQHYQAEGVILPNGALIEMLHYENSSP